jgi:hypothetical protein
VDLDVNVNVDVDVDVVPDVVMVARVFVDHYGRIRPVSIETTRSSI